MTRDYSFHEDVTNTEEFDAALSELLAAAQGNDVDPRGSWVHRDGAVHGDLEIMIVELEED